MYVARIPNRNSFEPPPKNNVKVLKTTLANITRLLPGEYFKSVYTPPLSTTFETLLSGIQSSHTRLLLIRLNLPSSE